MPDRLWHTTDQELRTLIAHHLRLAASNLGALVPGGTADIPREVFGRLRGDLRLKAEDVLAHRTGLLTGHMGPDPSVPPVYSSIVPIGFGVHLVTLHVRDTDVDLSLGFVPSVWLARVVADRAVDALITLLVRTRLVDEPRRCRGLRTVVGPVTAKVSPRPYTSTPETRTAVAVLQGPPPGPIDPPRPPHHHPVG